MPGRRFEPLETVQSTTGSLFVQKLNFTIGKTLKFLGNIRSLVSHHWTFQTFSRLVRLALQYRYLCFRSQTIYTIFWQAQLCFTTYFIYTSTVLHRQNQPPLGCKRGWWNIWEDLTCIFLDVLFYVYDKFFCYIQIWDEAQQAAGGVSCGQPGRCQGAGTAPGRLTSKSNNPLRGKALSSSLKLEPFADLSWLSAMHLLICKLV